MDKNKSFYLTLVVIFCVILAGLGGYFIGTHFGNENTTKSEAKSVEETKENEKLNSSDIEVADLSYYVYTALYDYLKSNKNNLNDYLNNLSNSQKLYVAGLINVLDEEDKYSSKKYVDLKNNLIDIFGTDLNLQTTDYYDYYGDEPLFVYNKETDEFVYSEPESGRCLVVFPESGYIYNYKLKDKKIENDQLVITYYGLYARPDEAGPTILSNDKNIEVMLNYDEEYLETTFNNNKEDFLIFTYIYKSVNGKYVLVDFK